jgi:hypothetical protein
MAHQLTKFGLAAIAAATLAACQPHSHASVPVATTYPLTTQHRMQAAHHWDVLAREIADDIAPRAKQNSSRLYVTQKGPRSTFSDGLHSFLVAALMERGVTVVTTPENALTLQYSTQVIYQPTQRTDPNNYIYYPPRQETEPTQTECIVTAEIVNGGEYVFKMNETYYINTADTAHYMPPVRKPVADTAAQRVRVAN